ncbi:hypothetical protein U1E44_15005 [Arenibacter sp. GZD96]|uniref:hypothetical protein n=1 Tax=Aurantibrevibacter litoralis TaxID=3106030 RepID=UPI002AFEF849|nr:hypothetical protein [Arenibacter sp. GZD-96]MEA1787408.1 hypothetical protein [Arenibacter sp. GZD-96]
MKLTIPKASHRGILLLRSVKVSPVSFWPLGQKPKFCISPHLELQKDSSDLSKGAINRKLKPLKNILPFFVSLLLTLFSLGLHMSPFSDSMLNQNNTRVSNGYLTYTVNYHKELPAFSRRPLTTFLIESTSEFTGLPIGKSFILVNYLLFFGSGILLFILSMTVTRHYWHSVLNIVGYFLGFSILFAFFSPIYTYDEPLQYTLIFLGMWAYFKKKWTLYVVSFTFAAVARETSLLLLPALLLFFNNGGMYARNPAALNTFKRYLIILMPFAFYALYLGYFVSTSSDIFIEQGELLSRFSCFQENFGTTKNAVESLISLVLGLGLYLYLLWFVLKDNRLSVLHVKFIHSFLFVFVINSLVVMVLTFARETRLFALPLFFLWPLASTLFLKELGILLSYKLYYPCFKKWPYFFLFLFLTFINYILSFKIYQSYYDSNGDSHFFNEYLFVLLLGISVHFLLRHFLYKNPSYTPLITQLNISECNSFTTRT